MMYLANAIGLTHILVEIWLTAGLLIILLVPRLRMVYVASVAVTVGSRLAFGGCPLTFWQEAIKHSPAIEPRLGEVFSIEVPPFMGFALTDGQYSALILAALIISTMLHVLRRGGPADS